MSGFLFTRKRLSNYAETFSYFRVNASLFSRNLFSVHSTRKMARGAAPNIFVRENAALSELNRNFAGEQTNRTTMNVTVSREGLWQMLQSLSLGNRKWLAKKLVENIREQEEERYISKEEILAGIDAGLKEMKAGGGTDAWELLKELKDEGCH